MTLAQTYQKEIDAITQAITTDYKPKKIVLFGSHAWGTPHEDSDIDLLIVADAKASLSQRKRDIYTLLRDRTVPVDILVYTPFELEKKIHEEGNLFLQDVMTNGTILYADE